MSNTQIMHSFLPNDIARCNNTKVVNLPWCNGCRRLEPARGGGHQPISFLIPTISNGVCKNKIPGGLPRCNGLKLPPLKLPTLPIWLANQYRLNPDPLEVEFMNNPFAPKHLTSHPNLTSIPTTTDRVNTLENEVKKMQVELHSMEEKYQFLLTQVSSLMRDHGWDK